MAGAGPISGILLGFYDISTKKALTKSNLLHVLALYTFFNFVLVSFEFRNALNTGLPGIALIFFKSVLVYTAWILGFIAIRSLPISIISPFSTLNPVFSILFGIAILHEKLLGLQIAGIIVVLGSYYLIGKAGAVEVRGLFRNKYLYFMAGSTFFSAVTASDGQGHPKNGKCRANAILVLLLHVFVICRDTRCI